MYWEKPGESTEPVHWFAADKATYPAHGGDPMLDDLLAGSPRDSRYHIRHVLEHLHNMVHVATELVDTKSAEMAGMLQEMGKDADPVVAGQMKADAIEDALAGLNGIAQLYTGVLDRYLRNS